jgi:hypothetical protein
MCLRGQNGSEKSNELETTVFKLPGGQCIAVNVSPLSEKWVEYLRQGQQEVIVLCRV